MFNQIIKFGHWLQISIVFYKLVYLNKNAQHWNLNSAACLSLVVLNITLNITTFDIIRIHHMYSKRNIKYKRKRNLLQAIHCEKQYTKPLRLNTRIADMSPTYTYFVWKSGAKCVYFFLLYNPFIRVRVRLQP
jgi:hypothetical protein